MRLTRRDQIVKQALDEAGLDLLVCSLPANVLLLSGYWPVVGTSIAVASREGRVYLAAPQDEVDLAELSWADDVVPFENGSLDRPLCIAQAVQPALRTISQSLPEQPRTIGIECGEVVEPASYSSMHLFQGSIRDIVGRTFPNSQTTCADGLLARMQA